MHQVWFVYAISLFQLTSYMLAKQLSIVQACVGIYHNRLQ